LHLAQLAYCGNRDEVEEGVIDSDPTAAAVPSMTAVRTMWTGTTSNLLDALAEVVGDRAAKFRARGTSTDPHDQHHHRPEPLRARKRRGTTVRTVRIDAKIQFRQRLRGRASADGSQHCGR
jgi:hypothetical protein